jgi:hypothetical protein
MQEIHEQYWVEKDTLYLFPSIINQKIRFSGNVYKQQEEISLMDVSTEVSIFHEVWEISTIKN